MRAEVLFLILILFLSCSSTPRYFSREREKFPEVKKVAVLPFKNISGKKEAGNLMTDIFVQELFNSGMYRVEEMGNVRDFFIRQRIREKGEIDLEIISMMGDQLGLDAVFLGTVEKYYQEADSGAETCPEVGLSVRMLNVKNGMILWKCYNSRKGDDYIIILDIGKVRTVDLLARKVVNEMIVTIGTNENK